MEVDEQFECDRFAGRSTLNEMGLPSKDSRRLCCHRFLWLLPLYIVWGPPPLLEPPGTIGPLDIQNISGGNA